MSKYEMRELTYLEFCKIVDNSHKTVKTIVRKDSKNCSLVANVNFNPDQVRSPITVLATSKEERRLYVFVLPVEHVKQYKQNSISITFTSTENRDCLEHWKYCVGYR